MPALVEASRKQCQLQQCRRPIPTIARQIAGRAGGEASAVDVHLHWSRVLLCRLLRGSKMVCPDVWQETICERPPTHGSCKHLRGTPREILRLFFEIRQDEVSLCSRPSCHQRSTACLQSASTGQTSTLPTSAYTTSSTPSSSEQP